MCNNSTLQKKDQESHHKEDDVIHHIAPVVSAADDSHIKVICDYTDSIILLPYFCMEEINDCEKQSRTGSINSLRAFVDIH